MYIRKFVNDGQTRTHIHMYTLEAVGGKSAVDTLQLIAMNVCAINTHVHKMCIHTYV